MKALIFGITGQDGSYLAELLLKKGYTVIGVTRRVSVNTTARIQHILPKIKVVEGDITDAFNVNKIIQDEGPDEIYNLAAQSHVGTSFNQPNLTWDITAGGVLNILEAIRYSPNKEHIRFYQASSSEMFGKNYTVSDKASLMLDNVLGTVVVDSPTGKGIYDYKKYQDENTPFVPQSPYGIAKLAAHHLTRNYRESYGIHGSCGILFNHESERRGEMFVTRKITKWISGFVNWLDISKLDKTQITKTDHSDELIYASGHQDSYMKLRLGNLEAKRDWGHAEDYVEAMWLMLQQDEPDDYVVATGKTYSVADFLDAAFSAVDIKDWSDLVYIDPKFYRPAEVDYLLGVPKKAEDKLGWKRKISFNDLAKRMVDCDTSLIKKECDEKRL
jgi:GDPmannose 4,6-dehydratase